MEGQAASIVHVVDGDSAVRDSLTTLLDLNGFKVESFATGSAFLKQLVARQQTAPPEWVVCEAELPDGSGVELFARMREQHASTRFILLVSRRDPSIVQYARNAGIEQIYQKPLVHRNLLAYIETRSH